VREPILDYTEVSPASRELRLDVLDFGLCCCHQLNVAVAGLVDALCERLQLCESVEIRPDEETDLVEQQHELDWMTEFLFAITPQLFEALDHRLGVEIGRHQVV